MGATVVGKEKESLKADQKDFWGSVVAMPEVSLLTPPLPGARGAEKEILVEIETKYARLHAELEASFQEKEKKLVDELTSKHAAEYRRIQKASAQAEKDLLGELEAKHEAYCRELEVSFAGREKKLAEQLQDMARRETVLVKKLRIARLQFAVAVLALILGAIALFYPRLRLKEGVAPIQPVPADLVSAPLLQPPVGASLPAVVTVAVPQTAASSKVEVAVKSATVAKEVPAPKDAADTVVKVGNKGNFVGGMMSFGK